VNRKSRKPEAESYNKANPLPGGAGVGHKKPEAKSSMLKVESHKSQTCGRVKRKPKAIIKLIPSREGQGWVIKVIDIR